MCFELPANQINKPKNEKVGKNMRNFGEKKLDLNKLKHQNNKFIYIYFFNSS